MAGTAPPSEMLRRALASIDRVIDSSDSLPLLREFNRQLEVRFGQYFQAEAGPDGSWAPNSPWTVKKKGHGIRLYETGALKESLARRNGHTILEWTRGGRRSRLRRGTRRPWAAANNYGTRRIPARRFMGITREEVKAMGKDARAFYIAQLRSRLGARRG